MKGGKGGEHGGLSPMKSGSFVDQPGRVAPIIKISSTVLHVFNGPLRDLNCERKARRIAILKENQRVYRLRTALNIDRQSLIVVISGSSVAQKESVFPVLVPAHHLLVELVVSRAFAVVLETVQNVRGMEIIHPVQIFGFSVIPRRIGPLILCRVLNRFLRQFAVGLILSEGIGAS